MKKLLSFAFVLSVALGATAARADTTVVTLTAGDDIYNYPPNTYTLQSADTGANASFNFLSPVFGYIFTIELTDASGKVIDSIVSGAGGLTGVYQGDSLEFFGSKSGFADIGTTCVASSTVACVINTGGQISLLGTVAGLNGGLGIFLGDITVESSDGVSPVPEPSSLALLGTGFAGIFSLRNRVRRA